MPRILPLQRAGLPQYEDVFQGVEAVLGILPNSTLTMARRPDIMRAFADLNRTIMGPGTVDQGLKQLVATVASMAAGCAYCQAHTATVAQERGVPPEKIEAVFEFEADPAFTPAERAALRLARGAGRVPNEVTDEDMDEVRRHFTDEQVVEIVAVIANFGFLNRWNDTMATELERTPLAFAQERLSRGAWAPGKHAATSTGPSSER